MRENKGITLIALVITIIVLLILAGVAIAMLSGENGILNQTKRANINTVMASAKEAVAIEVNAAISDYYEGKYAGGTTTYDSVSAAVVAGATKAKADGVTIEVSGSTITITYTGTDGITSVGTINAASDEANAPAEGSITWVDTGWTSLNTSAAE